MLIAVAIRCVHIDDIPTSWWIILKNSLTLPIIICFNELKNQNALLAWFFYQFKKYVKLWLFICRYFILFYFAPPCLGPCSHTPGATKPIAKSGPGDVKRIWNNNKYANRIKNGCNKPPPFRLGRSNSSHEGRTCALTIINKWEGLSRVTKNEEVKIFS